MSNVLQSLNQADKFQALRVKQIILRYIANNF